MNAYTLVDGATRQKMNDMLKTWKEPVPGSLDVRPVFPPETTRPIENALIKAKTAALQNSRAMPHHVQPLGSFRNTPTPPGYTSRFAPPPNHTPTQPFPGYQQVSVPSLLPVITSLTSSSHPTRLISAISNLSQPRHNNILASTHHRVHKQPTRSKASRETSPR